jgi:hypothetical protein
MFFPYGENGEAYEGVSKSFRTGRLERELQMAQLSATRCSCVAILWVSLVSFAIITLCVASQRVFTVAVYFGMTQSGNFWIHLHIMRDKHTFLSVWTTVSDRVTNGFRLHEYNAKRTITKTCSVRGSVHFYMYKLPCAPLQLTYWLTLRSLCIP